MTEILLPTLDTNVMCFFYFLKLRKLINCVELIPCVRVQFKIASLLLGIKSPELVCEFYLRIQIFLLNATNF